MPTDLLEAVLHQKGNHDFGSPSLAQHIAAEAMTSGLYDQHVQRLCAAYRAAQMRCWMRCGSTSPAPRG